MGIVKRKVKKEMRSVMVAGIMLVSTVHAFEGVHLNGGIVRERWAIPGAAERDSFTSLESENGRRLTEELSFIGRRGGASLVLEDPAFEGNENAWWGSTKASQNSNERRKGTERRGTELKRMAELMRRQLQPDEFSFMMVETPAPSALPTPVPSPLPTALPTPLPTPVPSMLLDTATAIPTAGINIPTASPSTAKPTTSEVTEPVLITSSVVIQGITETDLTPEDVANLVIAFALNDVLTEIESPDFVLDSSTTFFNNRRLAEEAKAKLLAEFKGGEFKSNRVLENNRRLDDTTTPSVLIEFTALIDTCGDFGYTTNNECAAGIDEALTDTAESGELRERILYWANFFGLDISDDIETIPQNNVTVWAFVPSAAPTSCPTGSPAPTSTPTGSPAPTSTMKPTTSSPSGSPAPTSTPLPSLTPTFPLTGVVPTLASSPVPTGSPAPTSTPVPTGSPKPTMTPKPTVSPEPTSSPAPTGSPQPTPTPTVVPPEETAEPTDIPPVIPSGGGSKKSNNNNNATLIIIIVVIILVLLLCCCAAYLFHRNQERKLTERKDSWDISTMFTDEANLPEAEEMVTVEDENQAEEYEGGAEVGGGAAVVGAGADAEEGQLLPVEDDQPQELQKITQAAEL